jgi:hypothetical protein
LENASANSTQQIQELKNIISDQQKQQQLQREQFIEQQNVMQ